MTEDLTTLPEMLEASEPIGYVLGREDSTPLEFWIAVQDESYVQLDDTIVVDTHVPGRGAVRISGVVMQVRSRHEGVTFDSDVFAITGGRLPADVSTAAMVVATRFHPEIFVPPTPGLPAFRARGKDREEALGFDAMDRRLPAGLTRDGEIVHLDLDFLDGRKGAHVNISGISGVATKTSYATFLLYGLFHSGALGAMAPNSRAIIFNVKGEDLLWLDRPNNSLTPRDHEVYARLGLPVGPFASVGIWAPPRPKTDGLLVPEVESRSDGVDVFCWTIRDFVRGRFLKYMFTEADDDRSQIADLVARVETLLDRETEDDPGNKATVLLDGMRVDTFDNLIALITGNLENTNWQGRAADGTVSAFLRRLESGAARIRHLIRGVETDDADKHKLDWAQNQVTVVDIHRLHDRAKRFVTGVLIKRLFEEKERVGTREPLTFLVLDELNRYAPREGHGPIKEVLLDIAERGRSLGIVLLGAEQTASEVSRRVIANSSIRVVGRLDSAEAMRDEYGFLPAISRARAGVLRPGSMILHQPMISVPLQVAFPMPAWATREEEAVRAETGDPFARLRDR